ncbi:hypothetical protein HOT95_gp077 [Vibrio phage vB_VpS_PG07]|uniref:Uncharacterized protein n=1 Tax=Vibrio phage vB_VpS_PG07 TaxID=2301664 RepID=A0A385E765_9CAUD|nr:hypothetical protein HOT95_gp077 [Vibrio phage vB_VpS_PG07]AXQ66702.1 hypothetical protein [Vibrio phage vB_VpS_PG07]
MDIPGYSKYKFNHSTLTVTNLHSGKELVVGKDGRVKIKSDCGKWHKKSISQLKGLANPINLEDWDLVPGTEGLYINKSGQVLSLSTAFQGGKLLEPYINKEGYLTVAATILGKRAPIPVHCLLALTYLDPDYLDKGLLCRHLDDNKLNNNLNNLAVGTYSENLLDAYKNGKR